VRLGDLDKKHPDYDAKCWEQCEALYAGGKPFRALLNEFLPKNPLENDENYELRKREASYRSYVGPIIDYYVSWLFSGSFSVRARDKATNEEKKADKFYDDFAEDCDGEGTDFSNFMRERMSKALRTQKAYWLLEKPPVESDPENKAEYEAMGAGRITVKPIDPEDVWDWEEGKWICIHTLSKPRAKFTDSRDVVVEEWRVYDDTNCTVFTLKYEEGKRPQDPKLEVTGIAAPHGFKEVPIQCIHLPEGMWILGKTASAQLEHFRLCAGLGWLIRRTCYAMPVLKLESDDSNIVMGAGYYLKLGIQESFEWNAPPNAPFDVIGKEVDNQRDEIFRICHQMAQGIDNNADTVGRSADSKEMDVAATRVMLNAYAAIVSAAVESTYDMISRDRGETDIRWSIEGFNGFDTATASQLLANIQMAKQLVIPSKTFHRELNTKAAMALGPEWDDHTKNQIREELKEHAEKMEFPTSTDPGSAMSLAQEAKADSLDAKATQLKAQAKLQAKTDPNAPSQPQQPRSKPQD
jgi:hypothetical protein